MASRKNQNVDKESASTSKLTPSVVPLAAKDSGWVGIKFYKPTTDEDEKELQTFNSDEKEMPPLVLMFPNLKEINEKDLNEISTSDITRLIAGTNPEFATMKNAKKLYPKQNKLESVSEEVESINTDLSDQSRNRLTDNSDPYDIELDEEDLKPRHKKRRKTRSDLAVKMVESSHYELNKQQEKRPQSKCHLSREFSKQVILTVPSSQESFGDDEGEL